MTWRVSTSVRPPASTRCLGPPGSRSVTHSLRRVNMIRLWLLTSEPHTSWKGQYNYVIFFTRLQCLNSGGTRGNAAPVRKLQPHVEGTLDPFKTHWPQSLPQRISTSGAFRSQFHLCVATAAAGCLPYVNQNFPVSVVPYFRLTMNDAWQSSWHHYQWLLEFPYKEIYNLSPAHLLSYSSYRLYILLWRHWIWGTVCFARSQPASPTLSHTFLHSKYVTNSASCHQLFPCLVCSILFLALEKLKFTCSLMFQSSLGLKFYGHFLNVVACSGFNTIALNHHLCLNASN